MLSMIRRESSSDDRVHSTREVHKGESINKINTVQIRHVLEVAINVVLQF